MNAKAEVLEEEFENEDDYEIEIEDDTPEEDQGREPMPKEIVQDLEDDELEEFSKEKAKQLKKVWHDERRAKEAAFREREEAVNFAKSVYEENKRLKTNLSGGEQALINTAKVSAENALAIAKREFQDAYDSGDSDKIAESQRKLFRAESAYEKVQQYTPQFTYDPAQDNQNWNVSPATQTQQTQQASPDAKAEKWKESNPWFGTNRSMTSYVFGLHEDLVVNGVDPRSDEYYDKINSEMRRRFPEQFDDDEEVVERPKATKRNTTVVASAKRTTSPRKVRLTRTQADLAKKLGLTNEQYAAEVLKLGTQNG